MSSRPGGFLNSSQSELWDSPKRKFKVHKPMDRQTPQSSKSLEERPSEFLNSSQNEVWSKPGHTSYSSMNSSTSSFSRRMNNCMRDDGLVLSPESSPQSSPKRNVVDFESKHRKKFGNSSTSIQSLLVGDSTEDFAEIRSCLKHVEVKPRETMASKVAAITQKSRKKDDTAEKIQKVQKKLRKLQGKAAIKIQSVVRMKFARTKCRYFMLKKRLDGMRALTAGDIEKIKADVVKKKCTLKERAKAKMEARGKAADRLAESRKLIAYMKEDNSNIRARNAKLDLNMRNLQTNNTRLRKNTESNEQYHERLKLHHEKTLYDNKKLNKTLAELEARVKDMEDEVIDKSRGSRAEHIIRCRFQETIDDMLAAVNQSKNKTLKAEIDAHIHVLNSRKRDWPPLSPRKNKASFQIERFQLPEEVSSPPFGNSSSRLADNSDDSSSDDLISSSDDDRPNRKQKPQNTPAKKSRKSPGKFSSNGRRTTYLSDSSGDSSDNSSSVSEKKKRKGKKRPQKKKKPKSSGKKVPKTISKKTRRSSRDSSSSSSSSDDSSL